MVSLFACGKSQATNSTPDSMSFEMNATLRASRSSLATTSLAVSFLQAASAAASCGRLLLRLPDHLDELLRERPAPAVEIGLDRLALRLDAEA